MPQGDTGYCETPVFGILFGIFVYVGLSAITYYVYRRYGILTEKISEEAAMRASVERDVKLLQTAWELSWSQVQIQKKLAEGGGGAVYKGTFQQMNVAVKKIFHTNGTDLMNQSEVKWMQRARHARLLYFFGCGVFRSLATYLSS